MANPLNLNASYHSEDGKLVFCILTLVAAVVIGLCVWFASLTHPAKQPPADPPPRGVDFSYSTSTTL